MKITNTYGQCDECGRGKSIRDYKRGIKLLRIEFDSPYAHCLYLCRRCIKNVRDKLSPLSVLLSTGTNTK